MISQGLPIPLSSWGYCSSKLVKINEHFGQRHSVATEICLWVLSAQVALWKVVETLIEGRPTSTSQVWRRLTEVFRIVKQNPDQHTNTKRIQMILLQYPASNTNHVRFVPQLGFRLHQIHQKFIDGMIPCECQESTWTQSVTSRQMHASVELGHECRFAQYCKTSIL